jgi:Holliday junction DNA helicase RuvA
VIAYLRGQILSKTPNAVVLDCNGVGYELAISVTTYTELGDLGAEARLHVHTHVREDALLLFGFAEPTEKRLFEKLLTISGIGPKPPTASSAPSAAATTPPSPGSPASARRPPNA